MLIIFLWSAEVFFTLHRVPKDAMQIHVVGKRWMWKIQHMEGRREINELHVPVNRAVGKYSNGLCRTLARHVRTACSRCS